VADPIVGHDERGLESTVRKFDVARRRPPWASNKVACRHKFPPGFVLVVTNQKQHYEKETHDMQARMKNPAMIFPEAMKALYSLAAAAEQSGLPERTIALAHLRASQINGCSVCVDMHVRMAKKLGETDERLFAVAAWHDAPYFSDAERAALALTESLTRLSDNADPVPDDIWNEAARHYDEKKLAALVLAIATINIWNRLNVATRQVAGEWIKSPAAADWQKSLAAVR
jgi:AhpD family alkylhydroperoxidase